MIFSILSQRFCVVLSLEVITTIINFRNHVTIGYLISVYVYGDILYCVSYVRFCVITSHKMSRHSIFIYGSTYFVCNFVFWREQCNLIIESDMQDKDFCLFFASHLHEYSGQLNFLIETDLQGVENSICLVILLDVSCELN